MNIAIFASAFHPHFGGVEEACRNLALEYNARGHHAVIFTSRHPRDLPARETVQGIDVWRLPFELPSGSVRGVANFARQFPRDLNNVVLLVKRLRIDVLHVQCVGPNGLYALGASVRTGLPLVVTTQGERTMDAGRLYEKSRAANWVLRRLLRRADYVTACSEQTLDDIKQFSGLSLSGNSRAVYNGIALAEFETDAPAYAHPRPYILGIGRIVPQKGFDVLLDAYARLLESRPDAPDLIIAGDGPERANLQAQADALGLAGRAFLIGRADRPAAVALFRGCEIFVLPSRQEPQGIVNLEAMVCGKPVVAANVGGVPEVVLDGETGLLVPGEDAPAFARALDALLADPARAQVLGEAGRARALSRFTWAKIADEYFEIYRRVQERAGKATPRLSEK